MKENKQEEISKLEARLELALSRQKYMDKFVPMPEQDGPFKTRPAKYVIFGATGLMVTETDPTVIKSHAPHGHFVGERKNINLK